MSFNQGFNQNAAARFRRAPLRWVSAFAASLTAASALAGDILIQEDFEQRRESAFYDRLINHEHLSVRHREGVGRGDAICARYVGSGEGSDRIIVTEPIARPVDECTLSYDVKFEEGFQFVQGGRLHGVGPDNRVIGQRPEDPDAWCARIRFRWDGTLETCTSHQDQSRESGDRGERLRKFRMLPGRYYAVSLHVHLNDPDDSNGFTRLYVNGILVEERTGIRFRKVGGESSQIGFIMFNTSYGGHSKKDAPRNVDGSFKNCEALFDNIAVAEGEVIRSTPGEKPE